MQEVLEMKGTVVKIGYLPDQPSIGLLVEAGEKQIIFSGFTQSEIVQLRDLFDEKVTVKILKK